MQSSVLRLLSLLLLLRFLTLTHAVSVVYCRHGDGGSCKFFQPAFPGQCLTLDASWNDAISSVMQNSGCCAFYRNQGCNGRLFTTMPGQIIMKLKGSNDQTSSIKCIDTLSDCGSKSARSERVRRRACALTGT
jgi:hypothetical protein